MGLPTILKKCRRCPSSISLKTNKKVKDAHLNHDIRNMQKKAEERQKKQSKQVQEDQYHKKRELEEKMSEHHEKEKRIIV